MLGSKEPGVGAGEVELGSGGAVVVADLEKGELNGRSGRGASRPEDEGS